MGVFTLHGDLNQLGGDPSSSKSFTVFSNGQVVVGPVIFEPETVLVVDGEFTITLPASDVFSGGYVVYRNPKLTGLGVTSRWEVPAQAPGATVELATFTGSGGAEMTPSEYAQIQLQIAALEAGTVADASTTVKGIVELATNAETVTGTDAVRATTPAGLAAAIAAALAGLPAGGGGIPKSVAEGKYLVARGHSYVAGANAGNSHGFVQRLTARLGLFNNQNNGVGSTTSAKIASGAVNSFHPLNNTFLCLWMGAANDMMGGSGAKNLAKFSNSITTHLLATRCNAFLKPGADSGRFAYSGFANDATDYGTIGSEPHSATAINSTVTLTGFSAGERVCVLLAAVDNATAAAAGGSYSITKESSTTGGPVTVATGTTGDQFIKGVDSNSIGFLPIYFTMPSTGSSQTVVVKKTDASPTKVGFIGCLTSITAPGASLLNIFVKEPPAGYANSTLRNLYNNLLVSTLTTLGNIGEDILIVDPVDAGWDAATCVHSDTIHPNDLGHRVIEDAVVDAVQTITFAAGRSVM